MSLRTRARKHTFLILVALTIVAGLASIGTFVAPSGSTEVANAQVSGCDSDRFGLLCLLKDAPSRDPFTFDIQRDEGPRILTTEFPCVTPDNGDDRDFSEVLSSGDEVAIEFGCGIIVRERQEPGWNLVDIVCDYENDYYDVRRDGDGIIILRDRSSEDSNLLAPRRDVRCTFVNRPERPNLGGGLGGLFAGQPTPLPTAPAAVAPAATSPAITPPRTGDAGLR